MHAAVGCIDRVSEPTAVMIIRVLVALKTCPMSTYLLLLLIIV